jgi:hypothetical protein
MPARPQASQPTLAGTETRPEVGVSPGMKWGIAVLSFLVAPVGLIMGIIYLTSANQEKKSAGKLWLIVALAPIALYCLVNLAATNF